VGGFWLRFIAFADVVYQIVNQALFLLGHAAQTEIKLSLPYAKEAV
jgi:hypothetical protein